MIAIPFLGSKRNYVKSVEKIAEQRRYKTVFEPFGGSAVLSVNLFNDGLIDRAIINDYDNLFDLYPAYMDIKDELIADLQKHGFIKTKQRKLPPEQSAYLQSKIAEIDEKYWPLLANNFVFSARATKGVGLSDFTYFCNDLTTVKQREYYKIVSQFERVSLDYKEFFNYYHDQFDDDSLLIVDPPYLNSAQKHYSNQKFFGVAETLDLLDEMENAGCDFIFFNMVERDVRALLARYSSFQIEQFDVKNIGLNYSSKREDVMAYVIQNEAAKVLTA